MKAKHIYIPMLIGAAVGTALFLGNIQLEALGTVYGLEVIPLFSMLVIYFFFGTVLSITIHELGHLIGGIVVGLEPLAVVIASCTVRFKKDTWRPAFQWQKGFSGGLTICTPKGRHMSRLQSFIYVLGGPVGSFLLGGMALWVGSWSHGLVALGAHCIALLSIVLGGYSLLPFTIKGLQTDGIRILSILRGGRPYEEMMAHFILFGQLMVDDTPENSSDALINILLNSKKYSPEWRAGHNFAYIKSLYRKEVGQAEKHLDSMCENSEDMFAILREPYLRVKICFHAIHHGNFTDIPQLKDLDVGLLHDASEFFMEEALQAISEEDFELAIQKLDLAESHIPSTRYKQIIPIMHQNISLIRKQIESRDCV